MLLERIVRLGACYFIGARILHRTHIKMRPLIPHATLTELMPRGVISYFAFAAFSGQSETQGGDGTKVMRNSRPALPDEISS